MQPQTLSSERKKKLKKLKKLMDRQNERVLPTTTRFLETLNIVIDDAELDYLLSFGTQAHSFEAAAQKSDLPESELKTFLDTLCAKGFIKTIYTENNDEQYVLNAVLVGWFESQVLYLIGNPDKKKLLKWGLWENIWKILKNTIFFPCAKYKMCF